MMKEIELEQIRYTLQRILSEREVRADVRVMHMEDMAVILRADQQVHALRGEMIRKTATAHASVEVPADAWSAFRLALDWKWLLRWKPAKMKTVSDTKTVEIKEHKYLRVCPHLQSESQDKHLRFMVHEGLPFQS